MVEPFPSKDKDSIKNYNKSYYQKNKAKLLDKATAEVKCDVCNITTGKGNMSKHLKTSKHQLHLQLMQVNKSE